MFEELIFQVLSIDPAAAGTAMELMRNAFRVSDWAVDGNYSRCFALVGECEVVGV